MENNKNIDYILNEVVARGYKDKPSDCNDFVELIQKKDFKDLIALELYEIYFWNERHEFDLELLKEIVENVSNFFNDPNTIMQIKNGLLQNLPSGVIIVMVSSIWGKIQTIKANKCTSSDNDSSWSRIKRNTEKIDSELSNHDYILTDEIEQIFDTNRNEIQPLLKLCGCKCFIDKKRSIWIKAGVSDDRLIEILKIHHFKRR